MTFPRVYSSRTNSATSMGRRRGQLVEKILYLPRGHQPAFGKRLEEFVERDGHRREHLRCPLILTYSGGESNFFCGHGKLGQVRGPNGGVPAAEWYNRMEGPRFWNVPSLDSRPQTSPKCGRGSHRPRRSGGSLPVSPVVAIESTFYSCPFSSQGRRIPRISKTTVYVGSSL